MDEDTKQYLDAMEARLMSRITGAQEAITSALVDLERSVNTLMSTLARRVTDLEKK